MSNPKKSETPVAAATTCSRLTGREPWLVAGLQGETIWANDSYKGEWWWPIVFVEMDTGLIKIDVCGKTQNWHLDDVARIRINLDEVIEWEDFFNTPENADVMARPDGGPNT